MFKKKLLKLLPYFAAVLTGEIFYFLSFLIDGIFYDLLINISAAFFAIPLLYFFYETARSFSHKKLNKELFDYAKMQVDRELLSIINQLQKIVLTLEEKDLSSEAVNQFISLKKEDLIIKFKDNKYLGFQIFKHWELSEKGLHDLLKNPFILTKMEDEQIISIIGVLKNLRDLEEIQEINNLYIETEEVSEQFEIKNGSEINSENKKFPDRYILLKHLSNEKSIVYDFGDIPKYNLEKCLKYYKVNNKIIPPYAEVISDLLAEINNWLNSTNREFIIDTKMFKIRGKQIAQHRVSSLNLKYDQ
jgi:hypothetical protein